MHNLQFQQVGNANKGEYDVDEALVVARVIQQIRDGVNGADSIPPIRWYFDGPLHDIRHVRAMMTSWSALCKSSSVYHNYPLQMRGVGLDFFRPSYVPQWIYQLTSSIRLRY